jgi:phosphopantothenoylcysteine decarboxylase/phosphopantothenate--cysteine ligase
MTRPTAPAYRPLLDKTILFGISGGIAAYRAADYARELTKLGARVIPVMTRAAEQFITPVTLAALTGEKVCTDMFHMESVHEVPHINLARQADLIAVIPATADMIARTACGMADDLLTAMLLSFRGKVIFCPAMNPAMFANPFVQKNLGKLRDAGYRIIPPGCGGTACGEEGQGRLADLDTVREEIVRALTEPELAGMRVLVSAGPTREPLDPVRYLSNRSSGRMGFAIAREAFRRGADVTLVSGPVNIPYPAGVRVVNVTTADEMASAIKKLAPDNHVVVMSAAVADYRPLYQSEQKIKKLGASLCLELERTEDIISGLSEIMSESSLIAGFCAETENLLENAQKKLAQKKLDIIIANDVSRTDSGFDVPDNMVVIIDRHGGIKKLPLLTKEEVAARIWDYILTTTGKKEKQ